MTLLEILQNASKKKNGGGVLVTLPVVKTRPKCPFYGFRRAGMSMVETSTPECTLKSGYQRCHMDDPDWARCDVVEPNLKLTYVEFAVNSNLRVFPEDEARRRYRTWPGLSFKTWYQKIVGGNQR